MKPLLTFQTEIFVAGELGPENSIPDLIPGSNIQNKTHFYLDEDDEIYEGYGKLYTSFPYRQYTSYSRDLHEKKLNTAVLENEYLKVTFLPELGGRLWSLIDKTTGQNLLYTNDVIRPSNLAIRNAWFSGGVEWNISMIGHTPFTMEPLFTTSLHMEDGTPVLRMYEYERVRKVTYQMDFWLGEQDHFLNCRMRIHNQTEEVVPMYWWSNIAVPEYENGRVIVPAKSAYTNREDGVYKVDIPMVDGIDVTKYKDIPNQIDYFFNISPDSPKYIANINNEGYGLLHLSTSRLVSRKLFSWGNNDASDNWQDFLTEKAGRYIEIQGGLGKTQYGCIPMAPHTAWEWLELYGPVQMSASAHADDYNVALSEMNEIVEEHRKELCPEAILASTKSFAKQSAPLLQNGNAYGAFECALRQQRGEPLLSPHLDFGALTPEYAELLQFLETGFFPEKEPSEVPYDFIMDDFFHSKLKETIQTFNSKNWYAFYQLGIYYFRNDKIAAATECFIESMTIAPNPWAYHGLSVIYLKNEKYSGATEFILKGYEMRKNDLSYLKETMRILLLAKAYEEIKDLYKQLPDAFAQENRVSFTYLTALARTGHEQQVFDYLEKNHLVLDDLRECENSLGSLWIEVTKKLHHDSIEIPHKYNYNSL